jgi:hypothetical protein
MSKYDPVAAHANYARKVARHEREARDSVVCARCGFARCNVIHETDLSKSRGTANMVRLAREAGVPVEVYPR